MEGDMFKEAVVAILVWVFTWIQKFWNDHGDRITFATIATVFAIGFIIVGIKFPALKEFVGAGTTILIGVAMLFFNKSRSPENVTKKEEAQIEKKIE